MAPVYALVISFIFVIILGAALDDRMRITFTPENGSNQYADELQNLHVSVVTADDRSPLTERKLDRSHKFLLLNPHKDILICTTFPWFVADAERSGPPLGKEPCWRPNTPKKQGENVMIMLDRQMR
jgi:hypothetical protein